MMFPIMLCKAHHPHLFSVDCQVNMTIKAGTNYLQAY